MFKSIRWRLVLIYFLLVLLAMSVVGFFIVTQLEAIQLNMNSKNSKSRAASMYASSSAMQNSDWENNLENIKNDVKNSIQIGYGENLYIILNDIKKTIIASSIEKVEGISAYNAERIDGEILTMAVSGEASERVFNNEIENTHVSHLCYPFKDENGSIKGYIYLTNDIQYIYETVNQSKDILTKATLISMLLTILLGLILSRSITSPIKELTAKAKKMSEGDFEQKVLVKSDDEIGQLGKMFNYLIDELKSSMSRLSQEKSKIETTFTYMADGVLTVDDQGFIIHINPVAKKILSVRNKDIYYDQIISRKTHDLYLDQIKANDYNGTYILETETETYKVDYAPFMDNDNRIGGVILVFKNITEQHRMEKLQREFVANVSHELKTPITTIKSYAETLLEGAIEDREVSEEFLTVINSESDRMSRIVSDLLKLSRMDHDQTNWEKEKLSINTIVKDTLSKLDILAKSKNIRLISSYDPRNSNVMFDRDGLEQILLNIIGNAIKYTPDNGSVNVDVSAETSKVVVTIKDTGMGIPKEDLDHVFERFYRVDKARSRQQGGTGLGLPIAEQIAKAHDSTLSIESELHVGTTVYLKIPKVLK